MATIRHKLSRRVLMLIVGLATAWRLTAYDRFDRFDRFIAIRGNFPSGAGAFLQSVKAGEKTIQTPEPHRCKREPVAANDSINETQKYDKNGRLFLVASTGGTDPEGVPAQSAITYWPDDAPRYMRGLPQIAREGELATTYVYPSESMTIATDPRLVKTTTELDTWNRPKRITIEKPGDPVVINESYTYDASGRVHSVTRNRDGGDVTTTYSYDDMGRQTQVSTNQIATVGTMTTVTDYDLVARRITTTSPGGATTTLDLDKLGRAKHSHTNTGSSPIDQHLAYDIASNPVFSTDLLTASASAYDLHGRAISTKHADGTITATEYDEWNRPIRQSELADDGLLVTADSVLNYTDAGRLISSQTKADQDVTRSTSYAWDAAGRTTGVATSGRASRSVFDGNGRLVRSATGEGTAFELADIYVANEVLSFDGRMPHESIRTERGNLGIRATTTRNLTGRTIESSVGSLRWKQSWDEIGNLKSASVPSRPATTFKTDARGAVEIETLPDGAVNHYTYHDSGAQASYTDPANEPTSTVTDLLGRPTTRNYADGTSEIIKWEGSRVRSTTDRQKRKQTYVYNPKGQLEQILAGEAVQDQFAYDNAGRLTSWKNADSELTWSDFDKEGRPKKTGQTRFLAASGLTATPNELDRFEQTHAYNEHGERVGFTMPAHEGMTFGVGWTQSLTFDYDPLGNLVKILRGPLPMMSANYRGAGRPQTRTVTTPSNASILRSYGYDDQTSVLNRMSVETGGIIVAGSAVERDGLQISQAQLLGVSSNERYSHWRYNARSQVIASIAGVSASADPLVAVPGRAGESLTPADFRLSQPRTSFFDATTAATLETKGIDTAAIDPPTATFHEQTGHKIAQATKGAQIRAFAWNDAERLDDGRFLYTFDAKGRLIRATEKGTVPPLRRFVYVYSGASRVIGRRAEYTMVSSPEDSDWKLETRSSFLKADGLPAETTFVWDPISDNLVAVFKADPSITDAHGGLLKQIIHGGAGYDDPIETTTTTADGSVIHLYPVYDEAGTGSLQAVLDDAGKIVARTLPNDPYGGENVDFNGAAIDRVAVQFNKNTSGAVTSVDVTLHATEQLDPASLISGLRLATVDADGNPVRTAPMNGEIDPSDPFTARWTLNPDQLAALTDPTPVVVNGTPRTPVSLSVAATTNLRATAWASGTTIMPAPQWAVATKSIHTDRHPFEVREPLASLADTTSRTLYAVEELSLLGIPVGDTLIENIAAARLHALPFVEPATGLVYARRRWYDPSSGAFLSPDPKGYVDSSNLYAFAGGDPVNRRDPTGEDSPGLILQTRHAMDEADPAGAARRELWTQCEHAAIADAATGAVFGSVPPIYVASTAARAAKNGNRVGRVRRTQGLTAAIGETWIVFKEELKSLPVARWYDKAKAASDAEARGDVCAEAYHRTGLGVDAASDAALILGVAEIVRAPSTTTASSVVTVPEEASLATVEPAPPAPIETYPPGSFSIIDWNSYPANVPRPQGPFVLLDDAAYNAARARANAANSAIRRNERLVGQPVDVHEIQPVKFGGDPVARSNKAIVDRTLHRQVLTPWWNRLMRSIEELVPKNE